MYVFLYVILILFSTKLRATSVLSSIVQFANGSSIKAVGLDGHGTFERGVAGVSEYISPYPNKHIESIRKSIGGSGYSVSLMPAHVSLCVHEMQTMKTISKLYQD